MATTANDREPSPPSRRPPRPVVVTAPPVFVVPLMLTAGGWGVLSLGRAGERQGSFVVRDDQPALPPSVSGTRCSCGSM